MELEEKLNLLVNAARYDVACGGSSKGRQGGSICHSWTADGRCVSLLKLLYTNRCIYDCAYCLNRRSNDHPRTAFSPKELADLTWQFYRRNYIDGLFLSSGVWHNPDYTMEQMLQAVRLLRQEYRFCGYIHVKIIPGCSPELLQQAATLADRISSNIELPSNDSLRQLAPEKDGPTILNALRQGHNLQQQSQTEQHLRHQPQYLPGGQSTQLIVGASPESDYTILHLANSLYKQLELRRVYYSAYIPVNEAEASNKQPPTQREHRLYQADWLLRFYGFTLQELVDKRQNQLDPHLDPKSSWALQHPEFFPVNVNSASREELLRVPGIGVLGASRIVQQRRFRAVDSQHLRRLGIAWKRARHFIIAADYQPSKVAGRQQHLRHQLLPPQARTGEQLSLFG